MSLRLFLSLNSRLLFFLLRRFHHRCSRRHFNLNSAENVVFVGGPHFVIPFEALQITRRFVQVVFGIHGLVDAFVRLDFRDTVVLHLNNHGFRLGHIDANGATVVVANPIKGFGGSAVYVDAVDVSVLEKRGDVGALDLVEALDRVVRVVVFVAFL